MSQKCLVLCRRSLMAQGVASLLTLNPALEVSLTDLEQEDLVRVFRTVKPEVVMVDVSEMNVVEKPFWTFLLERPEMKLVCLDPRSISVIIIRTESRVCGTAQELLAALENGELVTKGGKR